jgi:hypothetical protein
LGHDVDDPDPQVEVVDMPRQLGVYLLGDVWNLVGHSGSTPDDDERTIAAEHFAFIGNQCRYSPMHLMPQDVISDEADADGDDCGYYAQSVTSNEIWEQDESSVSPHAAVIVADRRFIPPQVTKALDEWEHVEWSSSPPVAAVVGEGRFIGRS